MPNTPTGRFHDVIVAARGLEALAKHGTQVPGQSAPQTGQGQFLQREPGQSGQGQQRDPLNLG